MINKLSSILVTIMKRKFILKQTFQIISQGLKNPRFYIDSITLKWRHLFLVSLIAIAALALNTTVQSVPLLDMIQKDITSSADYIPNYEMTDGELAIAEGEKPLYYQSTSFQLVIDDTVASQGVQNYIPLDKTKADRIADNTLLNLFLLKDQSFVVIAGNIYRIPDFSEQFFNRDSLTNLLYSIQSQQTVMLLTVFLTAFVLSIGIYWIQILMIGLLAAFFNPRLSKPLPLKSRLKLSVIVSLVPLILLQLVDMFVPGFRSSSYLLMFITLYLIYLTFRNHSQFLQLLIKTINSDDSKES